MRIWRTVEFTNWLKRLTDTTARARILLQIDRIKLTGNLGDVKPVGDGVNELRIDYGPGYRVYFAKRGDTIILLLMGGNKSRQTRDIEQAKKLNKDYMETL